MSEPIFQARTITICSVFPVACEAMRDYGHTQMGGRTNFRIEGAPRGEYRLLKVADMWQRVQDVETSSASGRQVQKGFWVECKDIASDLITHWAAQRIGTQHGHRPGIKVIAGDTPTAEELAELNAIQKGYFETLFHEAQGFAAKHDWKNIGDHHRVAARWLGLDAPWVANVGEQTQNWKECVACYEKINAKATICRVCRSVQPGGESSVINEAAVASEAPRKQGKPPIAPPLAAPLRPAMA